MSATTKKAIVRALLDGVLIDLLPKTTGEQVMLDDSTTLSAKLAEFIVALNDKATAAALSSGLAGKADKVAAWDGKSRFLVAPTQPSDLGAGDLWFQIIE